MMTRLSVIVCLMFLYTGVSAQNGTGNSAGAQNNGYEIKTVLKPYTNCWIYLGTYYGKNKILADSAWFNEKSEGVFKGPSKLPGGIYFFVTPSRSLLFELLMDKTQQFSIIADSAHLDQIQVTGSSENELFAAYSSFLTKIAPQLNGLQQQLKSARSKADSTAIQEQLRIKNKELNDYRENIITTYPESMTAAFFTAVKLPEIKKWPTKPNGSRDSIAAWRYMREHFWDGVSFDNDNLVRTPFFDPKLEDYYKYYVPQDADSIIPEVNYMLLASRTAQEMHRYLLGKFTDKYINPEIMGQDKVFLFLFNNYYSKGDTLWLSEKQRKYIFDRAYSLMANQINEPAPQLTLTDTLGKPMSLYAVKAPFTFLVFWDPTCGHCREEVPMLDSIYEAKWKKLGVAVFSVNTNEKTFTEWKQFIKEHALGGWYHCWQTKEAREADETAGRANFRQLFDVFQTPTMYLLDANKKIIAKKLSLEQYDSVIAAKLKSTKSTQ